jgi:hypothetical protein
MRSSRLPGRLWSDGPASPSQGEYRFQIRDIFHRILQNRNLCKLFIKHSSAVHNPRSDEPVPKGAAALYLAYSGGIIARN